MLFYALSVFCVAAFGLSATGQSTHTLPVTTCKRDSAGHSACLKRALEEAWPRFIKGLPEFDFPPLDPIFYKYGKLVLNSGVIRAEVILSNTTAVGLSKARFNDVRSHFLDNVFRLEIDVQVPKILIEGDVKMNGTLLEFRTTGQDHFNMTTEDVRGTWDLSGHVINDTWIVEHFNVFPSVRKLEIYFDDFFQGNKELNTFVLNLVNEFWPPLYRVILPVASDIWDSWLIDFANKIFSKVSFSTIFP